MNLCYHASIGDRVLCSIAPSDGWKIVTRNQKCNLDQGRPASDRTVTISLQRAQHIPYLMCIWFVTVLVAPCFGNNGNMAFSSCYQIVTV